MDNESNAFDEMERFYWPKFERDCDEYIAEWKKEIEEHFIKQEGEADESHV